MTALITCAMLCAGATKYEYRHGAGANLKSDASVQTISATNTWYEGIIADEVDCQGPGTYSFITNAGHPWGDNLNILFYVPPSSGYDAPWWSYTTVRDYTGAREYILGYNDCCEEDEWGDCVEWPMLNLVAGTPGYTLEDAYPYRTGQGNFNGTAGVRTTWSVSGVMDITEEIEMTGTSFDNSRIRYTVIVTNRSGSQRCFGIRGFFDINVAGNDGAYFWDPVNGWRQDEEGWNNPPFKYYVVSEVYGGGTRYIYGNISDSSYGMTPTKPDRFSYAYWGDFEEPFGNGLWANAWLDCSAQNRNVGGTDASVAYWWGYDGTPICLNPNESFNATTYFFASPQPLDVQEEAGGPSGPIFGVRLEEAVVGDELRVIYILTRDADVRLAVYDLSGREMLGLERSLEKGSGEISLPVSGLARGLYYMRFEAGADARTLRFVKR